jgi:hypothetical protein
MKQLHFTILLAFSFSLSFSQITITRSDMPNIGDSLKVTTAFVLPGINYQETGNDFLWDFSELGGGTQADDIYVSVSSTPLFYQAVFNWPIWNPPASTASPEDDLTIIPGVAFTNYYDFFKETNVAYTAVGFGITINGIPVPAKYNNPELLYKFPLNINSLPDSSESFFSLNIPDLGYFETYRKRVNRVDGWGTLITPFGTFQALRMKSVSITRDSIYVDSLQTGIPVNRTITEYKWLGNGFGIPLLTISKEGLLPAQAAYLSAAIEPLAIDAGPDVTILQGEEALLEADVTGGVPPFTVAWNHGVFGNTTTVSPEVTTTFTANVLDAGFNTASDQVTVTVLPVVHQQTIAIPAGWSGISSYLIPENETLPVVLHDILDHVVILQNSDGFYFPEDSINTLGNWSHQKGYFLKMNQSAVLSISGVYPTQLSINLAQGWNIIPVMTNCNVPIDFVADQIANEVVMIKDVAGTAIFWPSNNINTLTEMKPGMSYLLKVSAPCSISFPDCD